VPLTPLAARPVPDRPAARRRLAVEGQMSWRPARARGHRRGTVTARPGHRDQPGRYLADEVLGPASALRLNILQVSAWHGPGYRLQRRHAGFHLGDRAEGLRKGSGGAVQCLGVQAADQAEQAAQVGFG
jgi:hypothetical protein